METIQYEDTFALVGGQFASIYEDVIYVYNPETDQFDLLDERLATGRSQAAAFLVNEEIFPRC